MFLLHVLPTRTLSVKVSVLALIAPDNTSNSEIWSRAGGLRSAIGAVFALLSVGHPFGSEAVVLSAPSVAASAPAATTASASAVTQASTRGRDTKARRVFGCRGNLSIHPPPLTGLLPFRRRRKGTPSTNREGRC